MRVMKHFARRDVRRQRERIKIRLIGSGVELQLINGGGTGSFEDAIGRSIADRGDCRLGSTSIAPI